MPQTANQTISKNQLIALATTCGGNERCLKDFLDLNSSPEQNLIAAETLAKIISTGLKSNWIHDMSLPSLFDNMHGALLNQPCTIRECWGNMSKADQESFHSSILAARECLERSTLSQDAIQHYKKINEKALNLYPLSYVELKSEEIIALFQKEDLQPSMKESVEKVLKLRDDPDSASIEPKHLKVAGIALIHRAQRLTDLDRSDCISFYQASQLVELAVNCLSFLGSPSSPDKSRINFGEQKADEVDLITKNLGLITDDMKALGQRASTRQERTDFVNLCDALQEILPIRII